MMTEIPRNTEAEEYIKMSLNINECFVRGDSIIVRDTKNPKLYHFGKANERINKTRTGLEFIRTPS